MAETRRAKRLGRAIPAGVDPVHLTGASDNDDRVIARDPCFWVVIVDIDIDARQLAPTGRRIVDLGLVLAASRAAQRQDLAIGERDRRVVPTVVFHFAQCRVAQGLGGIVKDDHIVDRTVDRATFAPRVTACDQNIASDRVDRHIRTEDVRIGRVWQNDMHAGFGVINRVNELTRLHAVFICAKGQDLAVRQHHRVNGDHANTLHIAPLTIALWVGRRDIGLTFDARFDNAIRAQLVTKTAYFAGCGTGAGLELGVQLFHVAVIGDFQVQDRARQIRSVGVIGRADQTVLACDVFWNDARTFGQEVIILGDPHGAVWIDAQAPRGIVALDDGVRCHQSVGGAILFDAKFDIIGSIDLREPDFACASGV